MTAPDWIVLKIEPTEYARTAYYRLRVTLLNLSDSSDGPMGRIVSWTLRDVADPRYDLSRAEIHPDAVPYLGRDS